MKKTSAKPFAETRLVKFLEKRVLELRPRKTQAQIATEAGFTQANMLAMIKTGANKLPLDRVPGLAKALECDPARLFTLAVEQLGGTTTETSLQQIFGTIVTENEVAWLAEIRDASNNSDPGLTTKARTALRGIFNK